jgi:hypothetical protein
VCEEGLAVADALATRAVDTTTGLLNLAHIANLQSRHDDAAELARKGLRVALSREHALKAAGAR